MKNLKKINLKLNNLTNGMSIDQQAPPSLQLICKAIF